MISNVVQMYYSPGSPSQLAKWHTAPPQAARPVPIIRGHSTQDQMETLDLQTLELLAALEADLDVDLDFDADEDLNEAN